MLYLLNFKNWKDLFKHFKMMMRIFALNFVFLSIIMSGCAAITSGDFSTEDQEKNLQESISVSDKIAFMLEKDFSKVTYSKIEKGSFTEIFIINP